MAYLRAKTHGLFEEVDGTPKGYHGDARWGEEEDDFKEDFGEKFTTPIEENGDVVMQNLDKWASVASCW